MNSELDLEGGGHGLLEGTNLTLHMDRLNKTIKILSQGTK